MPKEMERGAMVALIREWRKEKSNFTVVSERTRTVKKRIRVFLAWMEEVFKEEVTGSREFYAEATVDV